MCRSIYCIHLLDSLSYLVCCCLQKTLNHLYDDLTHSVNPEKFLCASEIGLQVENLDLDTKAGSKQERSIMLGMKDGEGWPNGVRGGGGPEPERAALKQTCVAICGGIQPEIAFPLFTNDVNMALGLSGRIDITAPRRREMQSLTELRASVVEKSGIPNGLAAQRPAHLEINDDQIVFTGTQFQAGKGKEKVDASSSARIAQSSTSPSDWPESEKSQWLKQRELLPASDSQSGDADDSVAEPVRFVHKECLVDVSLLFEMTHLCHLSGCAFVGHCFCFYCLVRQGLLMSAFGSYLQGLV